MKNCYLLVILILSSGSAIAQSYLDSLYGVWQNKTIPDSLRSEAFQDYIYEGVFYTQPDTAYLLTKELYNFNKKNKHEFGMVDALSMSGYSLFLVGDYSKALDYYSQGLELSKKNNYHLGTALLLESKGYVYLDTGNIIKAMDYYQESLKIYREIGDLKGEETIYNEFGGVYQTQKEYDKSLEYYLKSLEICKKLGGNKGCDAQYTNIGALYMAQKKYSKALEYYQIGFDAYVKYDDKLGLAGSYRDMGSIYFEQGKIDKGLEYMKQGLFLSKEIDDKPGLTASFLNLGNVYLKQKKFSNSIENCKSSMDLAVELGHLDDQRASLECLYNSYKAIGNSARALGYIEQMLALKDSLKTEETAKKVQSMEFANQVLADSLIQVEKDIKVEMAHQIESRKKDNNRNIAIGVGIFFLLLAGGFYGRWRYVKKSKAIIEKEKDRSENLLLNILPAEIAEELKIKGKADARDFDLASILFTDFKGFTQASEKLTAKELIEEINHCFEAFDHICGKYGIEKIKTIGDAYMAAGGLPVPSEDSIKNTVLVGLEMQAFISVRVEEKKAKNEIPFEMRLGIHTGPVVAGIVGVKKFQYDIWGDTVNTASRMESSGEIGKVNISENTYNLIKDDPQFSFEARGKIEAKGKGEMKMYFVTKSL